jgi:miniconductance mechanosensitive channel
MTAVLLLIFKDPIMGLVAGIQLTANNMVTKGDWISMDRYGADGTVLEVALTTVKVQNWDKTIVTIPAYALVSDSFRNWRGMQDSGGRRIKRALSIDMSTVKICDDEMIDRFAKFAYLEGYIAKKAEELRKWNQENGVADSEFKINGRRMTNLGTFRAYLVEYLRQHPMIHQEMTFLVRHLPPTERGLPIEIYVFSKDQAWANYEAIQADIFDHLIAVVPEFDLRVFQLPSGQDLRTLREGFSSTGASA